MSQDSRGRTVKTKMSVEEEEATVELEAHELGILDQLTSLPPSRQLLAFYQHKLTQFEEQDAYLMKRIQTLSEILDRSEELHSLLQSKDTVISTLQAKLLKSEENLIEERRKRSRLESEHRSRHESEHRSRPGSERPKSGQTTQRDSSRSRPLSRTKTSQQGVERSSEVDYLKEQIVSQQLCHKEHIKAEHALRRRMEQDARQAQLEYSVRSSEQEQRIRGLQEELQGLSRTLLQERQDHRTSEAEWAHERTRLSRKIDFLERFGGSQLGENTEKRFKGRVDTQKQIRSEVSRLRREMVDLEDQLRKVKEDLQGQERLNTQLRTQDSSRETRLEQLRLKYRTEAEVLKARADKTEARRFKDKEGYSSDLLALRREVAQLEATILSLTASKHQEKENQHILENIRTELTRVKKSASRPEWQN